MAWARPTTIQPLYTKSAPDPTRERFVRHELGKRALRIFSELRGLMNDAHAELGDAFPAIDRRASAEVLAAQLEHDFGY